MSLCNKKRCLMFYNVPVHRRRFSTVMYKVYLAHCLTARGTPAAPVRLNVLHQHYERWSAVWAGTANAMCLSLGEHNYFHQCLRVVILRRKKAFSALTFIIFQFIKMYKSITLCGLNRPAWFKPAWCLLAPISPFTT